MSLIYTLAEYRLGDIPEHFKEMYEKDVEKSPWWLSDVPNDFKTQEMCNETGRREPYTP